MKPTRRDAYKLMHEGSLALAEIEHAGMRIDVDRLDQTIDEVGDQISELEDELRADEVWRLWKKRFGSDASLGSRDQLGSVLFEEMGFECKEFTKTKKKSDVGGFGLDVRNRLENRPKVDENVLREIDSPFAGRWLKCEKLKKLRSTNLIGVRREVVDGFLHPVFNLHFVRTYRGSSDSPNFQNLPIRDKELGKLIRSCFVPREDHVLVELDYSQLEVRVAACYHKDTNMIEYINDPTKDMHRDMAAELFRLRPHNVTKDFRFVAKNQFVFPEFYGSYFAQCAPNLWKNASGLLTGNGKTMEDHLRDEGVWDLEDFVEHVRKVEDNFWGCRFPVYAKWKNDWYKRYQKRGWFDLLTGFRCSGFYGRNDVINYPVQGSAFHCLLWSLIELVKWMKRNKMRSVVIGQIHDSIVGDVHRLELYDFLVEAKRIMTEALRKCWDWIIVPLEVEAEVAETNWWEKREMEL